MHGSPSLLREALFYTMCTPSNNKKQVADSENVVIKNIILGDLKLLSCGQEVNFNCMYNIIVHACTKESLTNYYVLNVIVYKSCANKVTVTMRVV